MRGALSLLNPALWAAGVGAALRHVPRRHRSARPWIAFRMETNYGSERKTARVDDLVTYLRWCRAWPRARR